MPTFDELIADKKSYTDDTKITLADGVETTLGQLRGGFMKDADYRRKTADLARQREEFDRDRGERESALLDAEARLQELAKSVIQGRPDATQDDVARALAEDPLAQRLASRIEQLEGALKPLAQAVVQLDSRFKQGATEYMVDQHRKMLASLKAKDAELDEDELVRFARANSIARLDQAYKLLKHDDMLAAERKKASEEAEKRGYERAKREAAAPMIPARRAPAASPDAPKNLDEALERAMRDEEVIGPLMGFSS